MALWICEDCTTAYAPGAPRCPHCGSTYAYEQGSSEPVEAVPVADPPADEEAPDAEDL